MFVKLLLKMIRDVTVFFVHRNGFSLSADSAFRGSFHKHYLRRIKKNSDSADSSGMKSVHLEVI